jgi:hypothetical protein
VSVVTVVFIIYALQCCVGALTWSSWLSIALVQFSIIICQLVIVCLIFVEDTLNTTELLWLCVCIHMHALCECVCVWVHACVHVRWRFR